MLQAGHAKFFRDQPALVALTSKIEMDLTF